MSFLWFPRLYKALWLLFLVSLTGWILQIQEPDKYNTGSLVDVGQKLTLALGIFLVIGTVWMFSVSWEQQIRRKTSRSQVEVSLVERFYGGTVFVRKIPRRIWNAAQEGDRLVKLPWSIFIRLQPRR